MEIRYERDLSNAYMVLTAGGTEEGYQTRMMLENRLRGFLPVQKRSRDGVEEYYYCISSRVSLEEYLEHTPLETVFLKQLIFSLCQSVAVLGEYLLTEELLLLNPETVFVEETSRTPFAGTFVFCIYPGEKQPVKESLCQLMKYLMGKTDPAQDSCAALCYELYAVLQKDNFCLREFMPLLEQTAVPAPDRGEQEKKKWTKQLFASRRNNGIIKAVSR